MLTVTDGDYYRLLKNGDYMVTVKATGYHPAIKCVTVKNVMFVGSGILKEAQKLDFQLTPSSEPNPEDITAVSYCRNLASKQKTVWTEYAAYKASCSQECNITKFNQVIFCWIPVV